ncbi:hypothetical protein KIL84_007112 [Mauremys mutica]|uniref:Uncharacterized protein n=1 Tax=Mauremys mutica TaxID=74926 RepID=A0A9D4AV91_9SAUR|nr:hypothetical protein KIL84_007112 [Mauremys mutica]
MLRADGADAERPAQGDRVPPAAERRAHQGLSLPDPARAEILALGRRAPSGHQAGEPAGEQQLHPQDLRLRAGAAGGAGRGAAHDAGGGDPVLPGPRDPHGDPPLRPPHRPLGRRLHLRRAARPARPLPGLQPHPAAGPDHRPPRHPPAPRPALGLRGGPDPRAAGRPQTARAVRAASALGGGDPRGRSPALPPAGLRPRAAALGAGGAGSPVPAGGATPLPHVHVPLLPQPGLGARLRQRVRAPRRGPPLRRRLRAGPALRRAGQRAGSQLHPGAAEGGAGPPVHQPQLGRLQNLHPVDGLAFVESFQEGREMKAAGAALGFGGGQMEGERGGWSPPATAGRTPNRLLNCWGKVKGPEPEIKGTLEFPLNLPAPPNPLSLHWEYAPPSPPESPESALGIRPPEPPRIP